MAAMSTDRAQGLVITAFGVSGSLVLVQAFHDDKVPPARFVLGTTVAAVGLAALAQLVPDLAGALAVLILVTSAVVYGGPAWRIITDRVTTK